MAQLYDAIWDGDVRRVQRLLDGGTVHANSTKGDGENAPLAHAATRGRDGIMRLLIRNGADVGAVDGQGDQAIHHACDGNHDTSVQVLLDQGGANPNAVGAAGRTPMKIAISRGYDGLVALLVRHGAIRARAISADHGDGVGDRIHILESENARLRAELTNVRLRVTLEENARLRAELERRNAVAQRADDDDEEEDSKQMLMLVGAAGVAIAAAVGLAFLFKKSKAAA